MSTTLIIGIVLGIIALWFIARYNSLVRLRALLDEAWSGIDVQLKRRYDLIPNLVETVKGYSGHEKSVFTEVTRMRSAAMHATGVEERAQAESGLSQTLKSLFAVAENYPELKANENFMALQKDLGHIESELQLARRYYNGTVRNYNILVETFPSSIVASIGGFKRAPYFEVAGAQERETPRVQF